MISQTKLKRKVEKYLKKKRPEIDQIIKKYLPKKVTKKWLNFIFGKTSYSYNKEAVQEVLLKPIWNFLDRGGKRWRPISFLLMLEAVGGDIEKLKDFAIIPEFSHEGSLCIDDLEDNSELRRGKPCLHRIFGTDVAINAGNFLYFLPLITLIKSKNKFKPEVLNRAYQACIQEMINIHLGQGIDIYWHKGGVKQIDEKEYFQMCAFKTGCLSRLPAKMAVILSEGSEVLAEKIGKFAEASGIAFQIQDDILDLSLEGKERKRFGKSFGNDIKEGKRTLMVIHTLRKARKEDKKRLLEILDKHTDDLKERKEAIEIIKKYGSVEYARKVARKIAKQNWQGPEKLLPESKAKAKLRGLLNYLIERKT